MAWETKDPYPWEQGYDAAYNGSPSSDNPYPEGHENNVLWRAGWLDAREEIVNDKTATRT